MEIRADEISRIIKEQIQGYETKVAVEETGSVLTVGDGIARVYGLDNAMAGELLEFPHGVRGMVLNLEEGNVGVALVPVGEGLIGRVVERPRRPIDGKGPIARPPNPRRRAQGPGHHRPQVRARAAADRHQGRSTR
jgi:F-type H+-transporting ATPase subunit alpha